MANSGRLLDTFTQLLAYMGDEGAQDGYNNINIRAERINPEQRTRMVKKMVKFIVDDVRLSGIPEDIKPKVIALKELADNPVYLAQKQGLLDYMGQYNAENTMRGGKRRSKRSNTLRKRSHKRNKTGRKRV